MKTCLGTTSLRCWRYALSPPDPIVLGFDTSAAHCAAAISSGGRILAHSFEEMAKGQAERLFPLLDDVMASADVDWADLAAIGVGTGPGNFTGIRIAVASARGLSMSLGVPAIGVSAFEALAFGNTNRTLLTVVDGRRNNVHVQAFDQSGNPDAPETLPIQELSDRFTGEFLRVVGHRAEEIAKSICPEASVGKWLPGAQATALVAATQLSTTTAPPKPLYVRPADAAPPREAPPTLLP